MALASGRHWDTAAVLAASNEWSWVRLRIARAVGATLGLTHGRVDTSSPILRRIGFTRYGEQRQLVLDL